MKHKVNEVVNVKVTGIKPYGVFVELHDGTKGLLHISEISSGFVANIEDFITDGQELNVKIIDIMKREHQVRVSLKAMATISKRKSKRSVYRRLPDFQIGFDSLDEQINHWIKQLEDEDVSKI